MDNKEQTLMQAIALVKKPCLEFKKNSYADDNTPFVSEATPRNVVSSLESCSVSLSEWFSNNQMKANPKKYHQLMNVNRPATIKTGEHNIKQLLRNTAWC